MAESLQLPPQGVGEVSYLTSHATFNQNKPTTSNCVETGELDMRFKQLFGLAALLAALLLLLPGMAGAQSIVTGAVGGIVTDSSGAVIAGAEVNLKSNDTGSVLSSTTTTSGSFQFTLLKPGIYTLEVSHAG